MDESIPKCKSCHLPMTGYDPDRGWRCGRTKCPDNIKAAKEQDQYNLGQRLKRELDPIFKKQPAHLFTVEEIGWILSSIGPRGTKMQELAERLNLIPPPKAVER